MNLRERAKRRVFENRTSNLQKRLVNYIEPKNLLHLEEELKKMLRTERVLIKVAN